MNAKSTSQIPADLAGNPAAAALQAWIDINRPMMSAMTQINGKLIEQAARVNTEWMGFLNRRLKEDIETSQRMMECKTMQDIMAATSDFFQRAQQQYQAEFQYFAHLNQKIANETAHIVRAQIGEAAEEIRH